MIADAFQRLSAEEEAPSEDVSYLASMIDEGEGSNVEFKSTLRVNLYTGQPDKRIEMGALKTIAGFLNAHGGTVVIGIANDGTAVGIEADKFPNEDKLNLHLVNLLRARIGPQYMMYIHPHFDDYDGTRVLAVELLASVLPCVHEGREHGAVLRSDWRCHDRPDHESSAPLHPAGFGRPAAG